MKRFCTIFPKIENMHIVKEIGLIPWGMHQYYGYDSSLLLFENEEYPNLKYTEGLNCVYVKKGNVKKSVSAFLWMCKYAKEIDILHMFYQCNYTQISIFIYLMLNRKGLVYIHFDNDQTDYQTYAIDMAQKGIKKVFQKIYFEKLIYSKINQKRILWGTQNKDAEKAVKGNFPYKNVAYVPDGFLDNEKWDKVQFDSKQNIILTVGRIGTAQKRTDLLLEAFLKICRGQSDWKLKLIGPIEPSFQPYINNFFQKYPEIKNRIEFTGPIYDRDTLNKEYEDAKIFCLSSDYESFGIAAAEALNRGCALVLSSYAAAFDITDNKRYGEIFEIGNVNELAEKLEIMMQNNERLQWICENGPDYAESTFSYRALLAPIDEWIIQQQLEKGEK